MYQLDLPDFDYKIQRIAQEYYIFDIIRKKYVRLTPEEWTRQHFIHYLINHLDYPKALLSIEKEINYNERQHRPDIVAYDRAGKTLLLVECKAPYVTLSDSVYHQLARYNIHFCAKILVVTNGRQHGCWRRQEATGEHELLQKIPAFATLI
jgi:hypothetical protein